MRIYEHEERLVALDDDAGFGYVWREDERDWKKIAAAFAGKVFVEGKKLTLEQAKARFPGVFLESSELAALK